MSDSPTPSTSALTDERQMALIVYILYLAGLVTGGIVMIVGLVLAYVSRDSAPEWLRSHFTLQIRTFWISLLYFLVSFACCFVLIGFPMLLAATVWFIVRCAIGINRLLAREAYPRPLSWTI